MKKDDYKTDFEEERQEIDFEEEDTPSRVSLHSKQNTKVSRLSLVNVLLIIFTLIPISILAFVFISLYLSKEPITPQGDADEDEIHFETSGESEDKTVLSDQEKEEQEKARAEKEKKQEEARKKEEEMRQKEEKALAEEARKKEEADKLEAAREEEARQQEAARQKELERQQAEKEKAEANKPQTPPSTGGKVHTVGPGETLYRISVNYYQSGDGVDKIRQANGLSSNDISVGQKLVIP